MDYQKIGLFIAQERKALKFTQADFAQKLYVSEKTVSKWENGRGLPDTSLLMSICSIFSISLNELLSGERLPENKYKEKAEDNMTELLVQRRNNKHKIVFSVVLLIAAFSVLLVCVALASFLTIPTWLRICLIVYGILICIFGLVVAIIYDINVGSFECKYCGKKFVPTTKEYIFSYHTFTKRRLKCPHCGETGMFKKRLQNKDENESL